MAVLIDKEDLNWKLQDMPGTGYEPATVDIKAVEVTPDMKKEMELITTSDAWELATTSSELEPTPTWNELEPSTILGGADASPTSNWSDRLESIEISNIDDKPTPTTSTDDEYKDQQMTGILRTVPGIINEETSDAYSSFLSSSPAVETEMPASSALLEEISSNTPSFSTTDNISEAAYTEPANAAYDSPSLPASSMIIDYFESESTSTVIYNEPQGAPIAMNAFSSPTSLRGEETQVPQPSIKLHIPDGSVQKSAGQANATPLPSLRILSPFPGNTNDKPVEGQANPPPAPAPAPAPEKSPDPKDAKASPSPAGKPGASPAPDAAKPSNSPAPENPPKEPTSGGSPPAGKEHTPNGPGGGPSSSSPPSKPNSPPGGGTPGGNRGGPGIGDYGGPFSGGQEKSGGSSKTTDEDLGAIGQIGVFESSATSQHLALGSIWMWIVALVVIWTTLKHRD
ncbi:hypothetical protein NQZ79_g1257 [Umbelopsis isabellina]|nr:hypothetical protein NQZ79_g1257 [Umbelopsis isabellina]